MHLEKRIKDEKREEQIRAMERALSLKTLDGHIIPVRFGDEKPTTVLCPHFKRGLNGERGVIFADEFADGKIPEDLEYIPGHEKPGEEFNGTNFDVLVYDDAIQNLAYPQWLKIQTPVLPQSTNACVSEKSFPPAIAFRIDEEDDDQPVVYSTPRGLMLQTKTDIIRITNFGLNVTEQRVLLEDGKEVGTQVTLVLDCLGKRLLLKLDTADIDYAVKKIQKKYPQCILCRDTKQGHTCVTNFIREQLAACPCTMVYVTPGFVQVDNNWVYMHDGVQGLAADKVVKCGKTIGRLAGTDALTAFQSALNILALSNRLELILPLFLLMHLGPLFNLFRKAGCTPRFVTFLAGTTGSLKTSLALCIFNLFDLLVTKPAANFFDTETALEQKLGTAFSQVLLVDDFCPAVTSSNSKQKLSRLETIIRFVGDQISKSRSTPGLKLAKEYVPVGCTIVTGESTGGSRSSLLRCFVLPIDKGDISGELLRVYQSQPLLLQTHMSHFLEWAGTHGNHIVSFLQQNFLEERHKFQTCAHEGRLIDTGATLMLTARILLQYAVEIGAFSDEAATNYSVVWRHALEAAVQISEAASKELEPLVMYLTAVMDLRNAGKLPLAPSQAAYIASEHVGYIDADLWWLRPEEIYLRVVKYWKSIDRIFPLRDSDVRKLLAQHNLIEVEHGTRDGQDRVCYTRKTTLNGRPRLLVLRADAARNYLEHELGEI